MTDSFWRWFRASAAAVAAMALIGCSSPDIRNEVVAQANGEAIPARELREFLGYRGGATAASDVPVEKKKEAVDRLVAGRLLAQDARSKGLDNTDEFRKAIGESERDVLITALFAREFAKVKVSDGEIRDETKKMRDADNNLSEKDASAKAGRKAFEQRIRKVEEDLIAAAKKATPGAIDQGMVERIVKGEKVGDDAVLATVGGGKISYGEVKKTLATAMAGQHGAQDLFRNPLVIGRVLEREVTGKALAAYAEKEGIAGSEWLKETRSNFERSVLINLLAEKAVFGNIAVTDREIRETYDEHGQMFMREGKKIPLKDVREQIRVFLQNNKKGAAIGAYIDGLKKKAKITVNESLLPKV